MKKLFLAIVILLSCSLSGFAYENQHKSYNEAITFAQKHKQKAFILFTAEWCGPCQKMKQETFYPLMDWMDKNKIVVYFVDIDKKSERKTIEAFGKIVKPWNFDGSVPTYYITTQDGKRLRRKAIGYKTREQFLAWLEWP